MHRIIAATLTAMSLLSAWPAPSRAAEPVPYRIAYIDFSKGPWGELCVADVMTEARACLTERSTGVDLRDLAWSPDGTMIAVQEEIFTEDGTNTGGQLVVVAADGSSSLPGGLPSPSVVSGGARVHGKPMWSSDSTRVAISGGDGILIARVAEGSQASIPLGTMSQLGGIAWSPHDGRFVLGAVDAKKNRAAIMRVDPAGGSAPQALISFEPNSVGYGTFNNISFPADGARIVFTYAPPPPSAPWSGTKSQHWVMNADGTGARKLYDSPRNDGPGMAAAFSPDGQQVLFDGFSGDVTNVFLIDVDATDMRQVTDRPGGSAGGAFSPDGKFILYGDYYGNHGSATMALVPGQAPYSPVRQLFWGVGTEWAPVAGPLPPGATAPAPTVTAEATASATSTAVAAETPEPTSTSTSEIIGPNTGSGASSERNSWNEAAAGALAVLGAALVASGSLASRWSR